MKFIYIFVGCIRFTFSSLLICQIENEYTSVQQAYKENGTRYIQWAGNMAIGLDTGVPWIMCKQLNAPEPVVGSFNFSWNFFFFHFLVDEN